MLSQDEKQSHHSALNFTFFSWLPPLLFTCTSLNFPFFFFSFFFTASFISEHHKDTLTHMYLPPQALQSLSLMDSRLRSRGTVLVNALGSNTCLRKVDLSGNNMDDIGAKMLSKALQINTTLR